MGASFPAQRDRWAGTQAGGPHQEVMPWWTLPIPLQRCLISGSCCLHPSVLPSPSPAKALILLWDTITVGVVSGFGGAAGKMGVVEGWGWISSCLGGSEKVQKSETSVLFNFLIAKGPI